MKAYLSLCFLLASLLFFPSSLVARELAADAGEDITTNFDFSSFLLWFLSYTGTDLQYGQGGTCPPLNFLKFKLYSQPEYLNYYYNHKQK